MDEGSECPGEGREKRSVSQPIDSSCCLTRRCAQEAAVAPQYQVMESPSADASRYSSSLSSSNPMSIPSIEQNMAVEI
jgi:hypothetical protein